jgi:hypothetical protein
MERGEDQQAQEQQEKEYLRKPAEQRQPGPNHKNPPAPQKYGTETQGRLLVVRQVPNSDLRHGLVVEAYAGLLGAGSGAKAPGRFMT